MKNRVKYRVSTWLRSVLPLAACICLFAFSGQAHAARTINWVTLNGTSSVQVLPGASITVSINVTTTGRGGNNDWESTDWRISTTPPGTVICVNHGDHTSAGTYTESFTITAPAAEGTYNAYIRVYDDDYCSSGVTTYTGANAIVVATPPAVTSIARASVNPVDPNMIVSWNVIFSKSVTGVDASDFVLVQSGGTSGASITSVTGSGTSWIVSANTGNGGNNGGTLGLNLVDNDTIIDSAGRKLGGTGSGNGSFTTGEVYTIQAACVPPSNTPSGLTLSCVCDNFTRSSLNPSTIFNSNWITSLSDSTNISPSITTSGYLRLTNRTINNAKAATVPGIFPAKGNYISVEFRHYAYNSTTTSHAGDGIAVTLSDYSVPAVSGAYGGSLGYAQKTSINGFAGGWIGVGLDEYGNYQNPTEGRSGGTGEIRQSVAVRGSGSGSGTAAGYRLLAGTGTLSTTIDNASSTAAAPGYSYQVIVDARNYTTSSHNAAVQVNRDTGSGYASLINLSNVYSSGTQAAVPDNWQISFTGSTGDATNIHEIGRVRICAQTVVAPTGGTASGFNAIDESYGTPPSAPAARAFSDGHIFTKIAGTPFKLNVAALDANNQFQTTYAVSGNKNVTVKLVDNSDGACAICSSTCTNKSAVTNGSQTLIFTSGDAGLKQSANFTLSSAYKNLVAIISDTTTTACSTDAFSVRPSGFAPATTSNATNIGASGTPKLKAGRDPFVITATANAAGYTGSPKIDNSLIKALDPATWEAATTTDWLAGAIAGSFPAAVSGTSSSVSTGANFTYSEVGAFQLSAGGVYDDSWTAVDSNNTKNDCISGSLSNAKDSDGKYGCLFGTSGATKFGRFIPDHFTLLDNSATVTNTEVTSACGGATGFTYMDQPFNKILFSIEARNAGNTKTQNYQGVFAYATVAMAAENNDSGTNLSSRITLPAAPDWAAGTYALNTTAATFKRDAAPDGPYDSLQLGVKVTDPDGSALEGPNMNSTAAGCGAGCDSRRIGDLAAGTAEAPIFTPQTTRVLFGRLKLSNAHGSERLNLPIPMRTEYWNGTSFVTNQDDSCTRITSANVAIMGYKGGLSDANLTSDNVLAAPALFSKGIGSLKLLKPTGNIGKKGSIDVCIDLGTDNPEVCKTNPSTPANLPWLQGNWSGAAYDDDPRSRGTFGVFKNANELIYIREMY